MPPVDVLFYLAERIRVNDDIWLLLHLGFYCIAAVKTILEDRWVCI